MLLCSICNKTPHDPTCPRVGKRICNYCDSIIGLKEESYSIHRKNKYDTIVGYIHKDCLK